MSELFENLNSEHRDKLISTLVFDFGANRDMFGQFWELNPSLPLAEVFAVATTDALKSFHLGNRLANFELLCIPGDERFVPGAYVTDELTHRSHRQPTQNFTKWLAYCWHLR